VIEVILHQCLQILGLFLFSFKNRFSFIFFFVIISIVFHVFSNLYLQFVIIVSIIVLLAKSFVEIVRNNHIAFLFV